MMDLATGIAGGIGAAAIGVGMIRLGWGGRPRLARGGWTVLALASVALAGLAGAWGVAIAATTAMAAALLLLAHAALTAPVGRVRPMRVRPSVTLPRLRIGAIGRRIAVFVLVIPAGLAATALLAFGTQAAALRGGWAEADATVLMLFLQPTAWGVLASVQLVRTGPVAMIAPALVCAAGGLLLWWPA